MTAWAEPIPGSTTAPARQPAIARGAPPRGHAGTRYRGEIDGLRALAVVPVILFHLGVGWLPGGFVGVDVFFVISGYLITGILLGDMAQGRYSLAGFYERRARRILPNLFAMILVTSLVALVVLIPLDLMRFGQSVLATLGFSSNLLFWLRTGYFEPAADQLPLLHTWSLGVEEQYYLLFPLALMALRGSTRAMIAGMAITLVLSFALAQWQLGHARDAAFYLPFARWWELMVGSLLAAAGRHGRLAVVPRVVLAFAGLAAILSAMLAYGPGTPFPGIGALPPVLGTAAILLAERDGLTPVGRLLSTTPLRAIGMASYSLYLWHWPVIVFARYVAQAALGPGEMVTALLAIAVLGGAAWRWIETPLRKVAMTRRAIFAAVGAGAAVLAALALVMIASHGLVQRYPVGLRAMALGTQHGNPDRLRCDSPSLARIANGDLCVIGAAGKNPDFALVGDSFGDALSPGIGLAAQQTGHAGLVMTHAGCSMLSGAGTSPACRALADATFAAIAANPAITRIVLVARWTTLVEGRREGLFPQDAIWLTDDRSLTPGVAENRRVLADALRRTIALLAPRQVVIVHGLPEPQVMVPQYATLRAMAHLPVAGLSRADYDARQATTTTLLSATAHATGARLLDLGTAMCTRRDCPVVDRGAALFVDDNHPSRDYALRLAPVLGRAFSH